MKYFIKKDNQNVEAFTLAVDSAITIATKQKSDVTLVFPTLDQIESPVSLSFFNSDEVKNLRRKKTVSRLGILIKARSKSTLVLKQGVGVIVAVWPGKRLLGEIDSCSYQTTVIALNWPGGVVAEWAEKNKAMLISDIQTLCSEIMNHK